MHTNELVSVVVVTYNSEKTVIETLDSIASQTYRNIELIVSDDYSKDDTVKETKLWIEDHKDFFVNCRIITSGKNTGTVKNLNRGVKASKGGWIKILAGDDCLKNNAIEKYVIYTKNHPKCKMCISQVELFSNDGTVDKSIFDYYEYFFRASNVSYREQWRNIKEELTFVGPTYFFSRELYDDVSGFDEKYVLMEEWPFCYNVLKKGNKIYAINEKLIRYRISSTSVCHSRNNGLGNYQLYKDTATFFFKVRLPLLIKRGRFIHAWDETIKYAKEGMLQEHRDSKFWHILSKSLSLIYPSWYKKLFLVKPNSITINHGTTDFETLHENPTKRKLHTKGPVIIGKKVI